MPDHNERFRVQAADRKLVIPYEHVYRDRELPWMFYDLNQGELRGPKEPEKVLALVNLARDNADDEGYGEHNALLNLVAKREAINEKHVLWHRSYHVGAAQKPDLWVSLRDWLAENGQPYQPRS